MIGCLRLEALRLQNQRTWTGAERHGVITVKQHLGSLPLNAEWEQERTEWVGVRGWGDRRTHASMEKLILHP